jgi:hypothetical protein
MKKRPMPKIIYEGEGIAPMKGPTKEFLKCARKYVERQHHQKQVKKVPDSDPHSS